MTRHDPLSVNDQSDLLEDYGQPHRLFGYAHPLLSAIVGGDTNYEVVEADEADEICELLSDMPEEDYLRCMGELAAAAYILTDLIYDWEDDPEHPLFTTMIGLELHAAHSIRRADRLSADADCEDAAEHLTAQLSTMLAKYKRTES